MSKQESVNKLNGRDFINIGIYTAIYFVIVMLLTMTGLIPIFLVHAERIAAIRALTAADDWYLLSGGETIKQWGNCLPAGRLAISHRGNDP